MKNTKHLMIGAGFIVAVAQPVAGHHSFAAEFDVNKPVTLKGSVTRIEWANPHIWVYLDVTDDQGNVQPWQCEGGPPNTLTRNGWTKDSFVALVVTSGEYQSHMGFSNSQFVAALYSDLLGRTATTAELTGWINALNNSGSRSAIAAAFVASYEYHWRQYSQWSSQLYSACLGRYHHRPIQRRDALRGRSQPPCGRNQTADLDRDQYDGTSRFGRS